MFVYLISKKFQPHHTLFLCIFSINLCCQVDFASFFCSVKTLQRGLELWEMSEQNVGGVRECRRSVGMSEEGWKVGGGLESRNVITQG